MSSDFPTFSEIAEENIRDYLRRTGEFEELMLHAPASYHRPPRDKP